MWGFSSVSIAANQARDIYLKPYRVSQFTSNSKSHGIFQKDLPGPEKDLKKSGGMRKKHRGSTRKNSGIRAVSRENPASPSWMACQKPRFKALIVLLR